MAIEESARQGSIQNCVPFVKYRESTITRRIDFGSDCWSVRIEKPSSFSFNAGQYAFLAVDGTNGFIERPCSIASPPHESELEFFLELVPGGKLTTQLHRLYAGSTVLVRNDPAGAMKLHEGDGAHHLVICTGTGVAPFVSIVRNLYHKWLSGALESQSPVFMLNAARNSAALSYREDFARIAATVPWFSYAPLVTRRQQESGGVGSLGEILELLDRCLTSWGLTANDTPAYLCGHPEMMRGVTAYLVERGFPPTALNRDS